MCGISGYWDLKNKQKPDILYNTVHKMNENIRYRGPDEEGMYQNGNLCMGMRRLSIIDISGGSQPIYNEDKTLAVVYNGEIYNFKALRKDLKSRGHVFTTSADTEVIVHAFEERGTDAFDRFDGMYAIALHDIKNNTLYLARDRMGEKPLYYTVDENRVVFGSELKCLTSTGKIQKNISKRALNQYIQLTYIPAPLSIYEDVYKVKAGHYLKITSDGMVEDNEYWDIPVGNTEDISYADAVRKLRKLLVSSVKNRMISDVPLGAFLSGGVDSASIVGLMSRASDVPPKTFTIGSSLKDFDERGRAREVVELNHTEHHERVVDYSVFPEAMDKIMEFMDEPFADSSMIPTYLLSKFVKEDVTVALTGDAGDELFAGYNKYLMTYYGKKYERVPKFIREKIVPGIVSILPASNSLTRKIRKVVENVDKSPLERHKALMHMGVKEDEMAEAMMADWSDEASLDFIATLYTKHESASDLQRSLYTDLKTVLEGDMLVKVDRMSMLNSLETRIPMLSKGIIEFSMTILDEFKLNGKYRKRILKDAMKPLLPKNFEKHPKSGFEVPVAQWMRDDMRTEVERVLDKERIREQGIFNPEYVERVKQEHFNGSRNRRDELWVLYVFEKWYEREVAKNYIEEYC